MGDDRIDPIAQRGDIGLILSSGRESEGPEKEGYGGGEGPKKS